MHVGGVYVYTTVTSASAVVWISLIRLPPPVVRESAIAATLNVTVPCPAYGPIAPPASVVTAESLAPFVPKS